jgi:hypothetical protein
MRWAYAVKCLTLLFLSGIIIMSLGCGDEEKCTCPGDETPDADLSNIWPNEDGTAWTYRYTYRQWDAGWPRTFGSIDSVPPAPSIDELLAVIDFDAVGDSVDTIFGMFRLEFDGEITTGSGVTAQYLRRTLYREQDTGLREVSPPSRPFLVGPFRPPGGHTDRDRPGRAHSLVKYSAARAEVHDLMLADDVETLLPYPLFLQANAWERTDTWIGKYGDEGSDLAWKFLESDLEPGHEFTHALTWVGNDVFLHCRILHELTIETEIGSYGKAIECVYLVDMGIWVAVDIFGEVIGWSRPFEYGLVTYAPTVGPVRSYERMIMDSADPGGPGWGDIRLDLVGTNANVD